MGSISTNTYLFFALSNLSLDL